MVALLKMPRYRRAAIGWCAPRRRRLPHGLEVAV